MPQNLLPSRLVPAALAVAALAGVPLDLVSAAQERARRALPVETTAHSDQRKLIARFTRIDTEMIDDRIRVEDPVCEFGGGKE